MSNCGNWKLLSGESLHDLEGVWRSLEGGGFVDSPFDRFDFVKTCADSFYRSSQEIIIAVREGGGVEPTFLPLRIIRSLGVRVGIPLNFPHAQYAPLIGGALAADSIKALIHLLRAADLFDLLLLRRTRHDRGYSCLPDDGTVIRSDELLAPCIDLKGFGAYANYEKSFSSSTRRNLRQRRQKLERECGKIVFDVLSGQEAMESVRIACAWKRQWLFEKGLHSSVLDGERSEEILVSCMATEGALVSTMRVAETPVAIELGFSVDRRYASYLGAFNPDYACFSPGQEQMSRTIAWCFEQGFEQYDLLPPQAPYKDFWTRDFESVKVADMAIPLTGRGHLYATLRAAGRGWARSTVHAVPKPLRKALLRRSS